MKVPEKVVVHPLVLLSVVDHYNRIAKDTKKRVVGVLLGSWQKGTLDVSNSFAVPFEEDEKDPDVWFLDHNYLENMFGMFRKVAAKEKVVGWYHTGPKLRRSDLGINEVIARFTPNPVLVIIDAKPREFGLPTNCYAAVEEVHSDGTPASYTFEHVASEIGAEEAEEIGVEHLLRDIRDTTAGSVAQRIGTQMAGLKGLHKRLVEIHAYLEKVASNKLPLNYQILYQLQDVFNLLPNLNVDALVHGFTVKTNDQLLVVYLASLIRAVIALHDLIANKIVNLEAERKTDGGDAEDGKKKEGKEQEVSKDKEKTDGAKGADDKKVNK